MSPGEIAACYRLYAAHRRSSQICAFPEAILAINDVGASADVAVLLPVRTDLEALRCEIDHGDLKDDLSSAVGKHFVHLRKIVASLAAQFSARGALVGR